MRFRVCLTFIVFFLLVSRVFAEIVWPASDRAYFARYQAAQTSVEYIHADTQWSSDRAINGLIIVDKGATLTIQAGTTIVFATGNDSKGGAGDLPAGILVREGALVANGTADRPVTFRAEGARTFSLMFGSGNTGLASKQSFLRHVDIVGGGAAPLSLPGAQSTTRFGAMTVSFGRVHVENTRFTGSRSAACYVAPGDAALVVVNSNFSGSDDDTAVVSDSDAVKVLLKDNWYGHDGVPGNDEKVIGQVTLDGYRSDSRILDPVILVPGIVGSMRNHENVWELDPILHVYDDLANAFLANGYVADERFFSFPYDWRRPNAETARKLAARLEEITDKTKVSKVDIVAHSMGGLVSRAAIQSESFAASVDQLVFMGTPHRGAPEAFLHWSAAEGFAGISGLLLKWHLRQEAQENGYDTLFDYVRAAITTVGELLPDYSYLYDAGNGSLRGYPDDYPTNSFLESLNAAANRRNLSDIRILNITSSISDNKATVESIHVGAPSSSRYWSYGKPEVSDSKPTEEGIAYGVGDRTVPLSSAGGIAGRQQQLDVGHTKLPRAAQCEIMDFLVYTSADTDQCVRVEDWYVPNLLRLNLLSPVDMYVVAPDGRRVGANFATGGIHDEVDGAFYSGSSARSEFITIPNPADGIYRVFMKATGSGPYALQAISLYRVADGRTLESVREITGEATDGEQSAYEVTVVDRQIVAVEVAQAVSRFRSPFDDLPSSVPEWNSTFWDISSP